MTGNSATTHHGLFSSLTRGNTKTGRTGKKGHTYGIAVLRAAQLSSPCRSLDVSSRNPPAGLITPPAVCFRPGRLRGERDLDTPNLSILLISDAAHVEELPRSRWLSEITLNLCSPSPISLSSLKSPSLSICQSRSISYLLGK